MDTVDCAVIGAGVVGLAVARALAEAGREVLILESAEVIGAGISSRSSEVIHAGIYYPPSSLMARFCVSGKRALYAYCSERGIPLNACGKLIVATSPDEAALLAGIAQRAAANGVGDLRMLSAAEARLLEPALRCTGALLSPSTGVVDSHAFMQSLLADAEAAGTTLALRCPLLGGQLRSDGVVLEAGGVDPLRLRCRLLINSAGLHAPDLARRIEGVPADHIPASFYAKGNYFTLFGKAPFSRLIYPVPVPGGLGTHLTFDMAGGARFGPDVEWVETIDYAVDPGRAASFYQAIRRYWPDLQAGQLQPGYSGIRPKISPPGAPSQDFMIRSVPMRSVPRLINLFGIESPGLTSALAIADHVAQLSATG